MKKHFTILAVFAAISLSLPAQNLDRSIGVYEITITKNHDTVLLEMILNVPQDAVVKCQSVAVTPILSNGAASALFPDVVVNGKKKNKIIKKQNKYGFTKLTENPPYKEIDTYRKYGGEQVNYAAEIPRAKWMDGAALNIDIVSFYCSGEVQHYTVAPSPITEIEIVKEQVIIPVPPKAELQVHGFAYLDFEPASSTILPNFKRNNAELSKIHRELDKVKNNPDAEITGLTITGYASPDERYSNNQTLAYERAFALAKYLLEKYNIPVKFSSVNAVAEDWDGLRKMVVDSDIPNKSKVLEIIDGPWAPDAKESKLRRLDGGMSWKIMIDDMFPQLRRVEYKVDYKVKE